MTQTRKKLRLDELDRIVEVPTADEPPAGQERNGRRFRVYAGTTPPAQDELEDLWNNVPV